MKRAILQFEKKAPNFAPVVYMLLAGFLISLSALAVKYLKDIPSFKIALYRFIFSFILLTPLFNYYKIDPYVNNDHICIKMLIARGLIGIFSLITYMESIKRIPISEVLLIANLCPIWTISYTIFIQKTQKPTFRLFFSLSLGIIGLILVTNPPFLQKLLIESNQSSSQSDWYEHTIGVIFSILSGISFSFIEVILNKLGRYNISPLLPTHYFGIISILVSSISIMILNIDSSQPPFQELIVVFFTALMNLSFQTLRNRGYNIGDLTVMSMLGLSQVVYGYIFDIFIFGVSFQLVVIIGSVLITVSLIDVIYSKAK